MLEGARSSAWAFHGGEVILRDAVKDAPLVAAALAQSYQAVPRNRTS
jgi:hypothetical protein